jgi:hypothetical protein
MLLAFLVWALVLGFSVRWCRCPRLGSPKATCCSWHTGSPDGGALTTMSVRLMAPAVVGVILAVKALRRGSRALGWGARLLNLAVIARTTLSFPTAVRGTHFPCFGWLLG